MRDKKLGNCSMIYESGNKETFKCSEEDFKWLIKIKTANSGRYEYWIGLDTLFIIRIQDIIAARFDDNPEESNIEPGKKENGKTKKTNYAVDSL